MDLDIRQCKQCGRLYQSIGGSLCPDCTEELDRAYVLVRDYIYKNPKAGIVEITEETGVSEKMILQFLKENRLSVAEPSSLLVCENCGKPLYSGRYCKTCLDHINRELDKVSAAEVKTKGETADLPTNKEKMHLRYSR